MKVRSLLPNRPSCVGCHGSDWIVGLALWPYVLIEIRSFFGIACQEMSLAKVESWIHAEMSFAEVLKKPRELL